MFDQLEALEALAKEQTMTAAGLRLRITQSAISKRIAGLEARAGKRLIERSGRRVRLTPDGERLLQKVQPLLGELRAAVAEEEQAANQELVLGVSESILSSWGARAIARTQKALARDPKTAKLGLSLHAHRSPALVERVRSGEYAAALCAGFHTPPHDLLVTRVMMEPMVLIPSGGAGASLPRRRSLDVLTIEPGSETWRCLSPRKLRPAQVVESFTCVAQMARCGMGHGLVPLGVARALGLGSVARPSGERLERPISIVARKSALAKKPGIGGPVLALMLSELQRQLERISKGLVHPDIP